ncbi:uncharacterized protein I206_101742 [Kwoniella pini CBS 10737]|uniref:TECPR1-like DysF domain-containing protein n=1 Tax=Kwoniella pini CBS 10737 TaxID=1296096 RepID=A0A1B9HVU7_9TREE|nr:uncharacterized protein I206_06288 [Kwoniella pini CBS 10737]OCF47392.1 hypothetical protein I206_06288 [Kwoniella pini CBS 10737]
MADSRNFHPHLLAQIPSSAIPIPPPNLTSQPKKDSSSIPNFPPISTSSSINPPKKTVGISKSMSLSTNVSDLLLSSLLPPNLPKLPPSALPPGSFRKGINGNLPRELSTQRESLSLPLVSNNFRRFMTRVGPIFWLQDRIEEVLFWRKPLWTWAWMMLWIFICFQPRILLLLPSFVLILIFLHVQEKSTPIDSLLGTSIQPSTITDRKNAFAPSSPDPSVNPSSTTNKSGETHSNTGQGSFSTSTTKDSEGENVEKVVVPPKETESSVDIYMNLQAIQNLMGLVSDGYDYLAPKLSNLQNTNSVNSPTNLPINLTHIILFLLPPTILLPLTPSFIIPYLLLPLGILPPLSFHPNLTSTIYSIPSHSYIKRIKFYLEILMMNDKLSDEIGNKQISNVQVWENQRLDPKLSINNISTSSSTSLNSSNNNLNSSGIGIIPIGSWSLKHLRASDKSPWVKVDLGGFKSQENKWKSIEDTPLPTSINENEKDGGQKAKLILALKEGWDWVPGEDWRIDVRGEWSESGVDEEGWLYTDDSWQNPAPTPFTEAETPLTDKTAPASGNMPGLALRRTTRRRRWWRRVYEVSSDV